jgi:hypothetical protein
MTFRRLAALAGLVLPGALAAQAGPRAPVILQLPAGARTLGLGNIGAVLRDDDVIFFNPAQLVNATGFSVSGEWLSSTAGTGALSAVTRFNGGGIGIGMRMANYELPAGTYPATRHTMLDPGESAGASMEATIGIAQSIKGIRVGIAAKYAEDVVSSVRLSRPLVDVGLSKDLFRMTLGLVVQNIGRDFGSDQPAGLPVRTTFAVGHGRQLGPVDIVAVGAVSLLRDEYVQPAGGLEVNYSWLNGYTLAVRGGVRRSTVGEEPLTLGAGYTMDRITVDYALETLSNQRVGHRFGIRVR